MNLRIGVLSIAHVHAVNYAAILKSLPGTELVGFSEEDRNGGQQFAEKHELRRFSHPQDLITEGLDGVVICSENAYHRELVEMAAEAKCHVLCEKPIATDLGAARSILAACEKNGVRFMTAFPMRFAPSTQAVRKMILSNEFGSVLGVNGVNHS
ncbi:MAG TPA: Gfo/Idh/MocA family oxidoreductase, partial [Chthoniobacterales bacterium]|nr:Gfo/Idh/MocA family oxidoreductase [Chthoniobacterales bacterium]